MMSGYESKRAVSAAKQYSEYFEYLDALRESGVTNMMGAGNYLENQFDLSRDEANFIFMKWIQFFGKTRSPAAQ